MSKPPANPRTVTVRLASGEVVPVRMMKNDPTRNPLCLDCRVDTDGINEDYMVLDEVWRAAHPAEAGRLCCSCLETRLGRQLTRADFPWSVTAGKRVDLPYSGRLKARLQQTPRHRPARKS